MATAPIILEHEVASGVHRGRSVRASILRAATAVLVSRGADEILVPVPTSVTREAVETAVSELPEERRKTVRLIDSSGSVLARIDDYLEPLLPYATKWPEDAFVSFARDFLYHLALATKATASVAEHSVGVVRGFVPILTPALFRGEGRYRLAELINLIAAYEPAEASQGVIAAPFGDQALRNNLLDVLESAEFRRLIATSGLLGFLYEPAIGLRRISRLFRRIVASRKAQTSLSVAASIANTGTLATVAKGAEKLMDLGRDLPRAFAPPFLPLDIARLSVYRIALQEAFRSAEPPHGTSMVLERSRGGVSWLSQGEESMRYPPLAERLEREKNETRDCRRVQQLLYS